MATNFDVQSVKNCFWRKQRLNNALAAIECERREGLKYSETRYNWPCVIRPGVSCTVSVWNFSDYIPWEDLLQRIMTLMNCQFLKTELKPGHLNHPRSVDQRKKDIILRQFPFISLPLIIIKLSRFNRQHDTGKKSRRNKWMIDAFYDWYIATLATVAIVFVTEVR